LLATEETHLREATRVAGRATFAVFKQNIITDKKERKSSKKKKKMRIHPLHFISPPRFIYTEFPFRVFQEKKGTFFFYFIYSQILVQQVFHAINVKYAV
jgi:hypothetical protein